MAKINENDKFKKYALYNTISSTHTQCNYFWHLFAVVVLYECMSLGVHSVHLYFKNKVSKHSQHIIIEII